MIHLVTIVSQPSSQLRSRWIAHTVTVTMTVAIPSPAVPSSTTERSGTVPET